MRAAAAVFEKLVSPLGGAEEEVDSPGPGQALVKVVAAGDCPADAIAREGDMPFPVPGVLGHAFEASRAGDVVKPVLRMPE